MADLESRDRAKWPPDPQAAAVAIFEIVRGKFLEDVSRNLTGVKKKNGIEAGKADGVAVFHGANNAISIAKPTAAKSTNRSYSAYLAEVIERNLFVGKRPGNFAFQSEN